MNTLQSAALFFFLEGMKTFGVPIKQASVDIYKQVDDVTMPKGYEDLQDFAYSIVDAVNLLNNATVGGDTWNIMHQNTKYVLSFLDYEQRDHSGIDRNYIAIWLVLFLAILFYIIVKVVEAKHKEKDEKTEEQ